MIYLMLFLALNLTSVRQVSTENPALEEISTTDSLKFTSGIRAIFQDSNGDYWFGSHNEGIGHYDGKSFEYFTTKDGLADNQIYSIQEDALGTLWFGTANGVSSYDGERIISHPAAENSESAWAKNDTDHWFPAGTQQGVYRHDGQTINYLAFPNPKVISSGNVYAVTGISQGKNNMLWFATYAGVFGYDGDHFVTINDESLKITEASEKLHVRSILEDSQGRLWIGNNGIGVILKSGDSFTNFSKAQGKLLPMTEFETNTLNKQFTKNTGLQSVFAIAEDSEGNIWFGDRDSGAWKFDGKTLTNYQIGDTLSNPMIWTIYNDNDNRLLFGLADGSVVMFNGTSFDRQF